MKSPRIFSLFIFCWLLAHLASAQILVPTHLSTALSQPTARVGEEVELIINARIDDKWHLYATDFSEDVGPVVFTLKFTPSPAYALVGKPKSIGSHHEQDEVFKGEVAFWEKAGQIRQRIRLLKAGALTIKAEADYQTCTDVDGRCIPGNELVTFGPLSVTGAAPAGKATGAVLPPKTDPASTPTAKAAGAVTPEAAPAAEPAVSGATAAAAAPAPADTLKDPAPAVASSAEVIASAAPATGAAAEASAAGASSAAAAAGDGLGLWQFLVLAFGAGLFAVIMPCVYPMLPMTVSYFTNAGGTRRRGIAMAIVYGLSIITIYTGVGIVLSLIFGADTGSIISSHWLPNLLSFAIFVTFGLSFLGLFEINAPSSLVNKVDAKADQGGWSGLFFMAATLVLVSFSCTVPIVGSVAIAASKGELLRPTLGMLSFSLAFASPFVVLALFPTLLKSLPRSGGWLNVLKVIFGFLELALAFKFLSSADLSYHWGLLPRPLFLTIWIVLAALLGSYLLGKIRLPHDSETAHVSVPRLVLAAACFIFMVYLIPGLFGAPLAGLSAIVPPPSRHDFTLAGESAVSSSAPAAAGQARLNKLCEAPQYAATLELPLGLAGYFDLQQAIRCAQQSGKPVFIDFTGHNCGNCRRMEASVWADEQVLRSLSDDYIVVALYADDKTELPREKWYTSKRDGRVKKSMGEQNLDFQISQFQANAQPYYALIDPNNPTGAPLVPPVAYEPDVARFQAFLQKGLKEFKQRQALAAR